MYIRLTLKLLPLIIFMCLTACDSRVVDVPFEKESHVNIYEMKLTDLHGKSFDTLDLIGTVTLVVNVASECGYTRQYEDLQTLNDKYDNFQVIGFPCNDFGGQEPGDVNTIIQCASKHGASFPLMAKIEIKDETNRDDLYQQLVDITGEVPSWNFGKYLIDKQGRPVAFFGSSVEPLSQELTTRIDALLD